MQFPILPLFKESQRTGVEVIQRNPRLYTPSDFDYSPCFEIIKYPIVDMSLSCSLYRHLPCNRDMFSNDHGQLFASFTQSSNVLTSNFAEKDPQPQIKAQPQEINLLVALNKEDDTKPSYYN